MSDPWLERAEGIADQYLIEAGIPGTPVNLIMAGEPLMPKFRTITISLPADAPHHGLHQAVQDWAIGLGLTMACSQSAGGWFVRERTQLTPKEIVGATVRPEFMRRTEAAPPLPLTALDELDLAGAF